MKKRPLIILLIASFCLFTLIGLAGYKNIYALEEQNFLSTPFLSRVFTGINNEHYPWDLFSKEKRLIAKDEALKVKEEEERMKLRALELEEEERLKALATPTPTPTKAPLVTAPPTPTPEPTPKYPEGRYEPLSETTYDEYLAHISADIYGDMGVLRAAEYEFDEVDITYFDDALFIGDSRTVGLRNYSELSEHADFLCSTSLTIWDVLKTDFKGAGTLDSFLDRNEYSKIYVMIGVNELGTGKTEDFMSEYTKVVDYIHEKEPDAIIFIQAIMNVDMQKSTTDSIYNNDNIMARNHAIATLADNKTIFYIDENEVLTDENGYLLDDLRGDHLHLNAGANEYWVEFLLKHGVNCEEKAENKENN